MHAELLKPTHNHLLRLLRHRHCIHLSITDSLSHSHASVTKCVLPLPASVPIAFLYPLVLKRYNSKSDSVRVPMNPTTTKCISSQCPVPNGFHASCCSLKGKNYTAVGIIILKTNQNPQFFSPCTLSVLLFKESLFPRVLITH